MFSGFSLLPMQGSSFDGFDLCRAQRATRAHLYESLGSWMRHVAEDKLQVYVERLGVQHVSQDRGPRTCGPLLRGLAGAMALPNPPKHCWTLLCSTVEKIYSDLPDCVQVGPRARPGPRTSGCPPF